MAFLCCYRPQRSWGKVIFSQASVILLTGGEGRGRGVWCCPSMHCRWYPSMPCSRSRGGLLLGGGVLGPGGGACSQGGAWFWGVPLPRGLAFCYGLLLWSSVMPFWFGGLLIEGGLLVWSSGGQKAITEGHHTRRP